MTTTIIIAIVTVAALFVGGVIGFLVGAVTGRLGTLAVLNEAGYVLHKNEDGSQTLSEIKKVADVKK